MLIAVVFPVVVCSLFFPEFTSFILSADYLTLKGCYPKFYLPIYIFIKAIKLAGLAILLLLSIKLHYLYSVVLKSIKWVYIFAKREKTLLERGKDKSNYSCIYSFHFGDLQIGLLFSTLCIYFFIPQFAETEQAFACNLYLSRTYIFSVFICTFFFVIINSKYFIAVVVNFLFIPVSPYNLAFYRILFFSVLIFEYSGYAISKTQIIESKPREPLPFIGWLIEIIPLNQNLYLYACIAGIICCLFLVAGLVTRFFLFANAILVFYIAASPNFYGKLWHAQLPIWISWILLFAQVSDVFSVDKLLFKKNKPVGKSSNYNFPIKIIWLQIGFIYFWSGFYKLTDVGFDWCMGPNMINQVRLEWFEHYDKIPILRIDKIPILLNAGGFIVIFFELSFVFMLLYDRLKYLSIFGGLIMHNVIGLIMYISFPLLQLQYIVFINFEKAADYLSRRFHLSLVQNDLKILKKPLNKMLILFSCIILCFNFIFGMMKVSSYPFSVYPTYSDLVGSEREYLYFQIADSNKKNIDIYALGKESGFNRENFTRPEYAIIKKYNENSVIDTVAIYNQWKWWSTQVQQLKKIDVVDVYICKRSLNPDSAHILLAKSHLCRIYTNNSLRSN